MSSSKISDNSISQNTKFIKNEKKRDLTQTENLSGTKTEVSSNNENDIGSCFGGLNEEESRKLQEELERAKQERENNLHSKSNCEIQ